MRMALPSPGVGDIAVFEVRIWVMPQLGNTKPYPKTCNTQPLVTDLEEISSGFSHVR